jgi:hypothetical protein
MPGVHRPGVVYPFFYCLNVSILYSACYLRFQNRSGLVCAAVREGGLFLLSSRRERGIILRNVVDREGCGVDAMG